MIKGYTPSNVGVKEFHLFSLSKRKLMGTLYVPLYGVNIHLKIHALAQADKDPRPTILIYSYL